MTMIQGAAQDLPRADSDDEIRKLLVERVDTYRHSVAIVVGIVEPTGRRVIAYGTRSKSDATPVDGDTVFELASVTKAFTSLLLADAVTRGEVALNDPVSQYLPPSVRMPERAGRSITVHDLATHTSGLPREPSNLQPKDPSNPFADYSVDQLYQFLSGHQLTRDDERATVACACFRCRTGVGHREEPRDGDHVRQRPVRRLSHVAWI